MNLRISIAVCFLFQMQE